MISTTQALKRKKSPAAAVDNTLTTPPKKKKTNAAPRDNAQVPAVDGAQTPTRPAYNEITDDIILAAVVLVKNRFSVQLTALLLNAVRTTLRNKLKRCRQLPSLPGFAYAGDSTTPTSNGPYLAAHAEEEDSQIPETNVPVVAAHADDDALSSVAVTIQDVEEEASLRDHCANDHSFEHDPYESDKHDEVENDHAAAEEDVVMREVRCEDEHTEIEEQSVNAEAHETRNSPRSSTAETPDTFSFLREMRDHFHEFIHGEELDDAPPLDEIIHSTDRVVQYNIDSSVAQLVPSMERTGMEELNAAFAAFEDDEEFDNAPIRVLRHALLREPVLREGWEDPAEALRFAQSSRDSYVTTLDFPDPAMPCLAYHTSASRQCKNSKCTQQHGGSSMVSLLWFLQRRNTSIDICVYLITSQLVRDLPGYPVGSLSPCLMCELCVCFADCQHGRVGLKAYPSSDYTGW